MAYTVLDVSLPLITTAMDLAELHALRGYDAVQLAAALALRERCLKFDLPAPLLLVSDNELAQAALSEGLIIDNPALHL